MAIILSGGSAYYTKRSYDLNAIRDQREVMEKRPAVDVQLRPAGLSDLSVKVSIINRSNTNIIPLDIEAEHSFDAGTLYFSNDEQSIDQLRSILSLASMGTIAPSGTRTATATLSGITNGKFEQFQAGLELGFIIRVRLADEQDTIENIKLIRRILPRPEDRHQIEPTPQMFLAIIEDMQRARRNQQLIIFTLAGSGVAGAIAYILFRLRRRRQSRRIEEGTNDGTASVSANESQLVATSKLKED